jgi:hypothetical protein
MLLFTNENEIVGSFIKIYIFTTEKKLQKLCVNLYYYLH